MVGLVLGAFVDGGAEEYQYINIKSPSLRKIPLAVPEFTTLVPSVPARDAAGKSAALFRENIAFSGYFKILGLEGETPLPVLKGVVATEIDFSAWREVGAELLVTAGVVVTGDGKMAFECRLFDVFKESLVVGKRYRSKVGDERRVVRRFCSEVVYAITGRRGLYESRIAFVSSNGGTKEIFTCDFDGTEVRQETRDGSIALSPAWSPDGKWMAYTSYKQGNPDLFIRNLREQRGVVVSKPGINVTPAWIPGSFKLAATFSHEGDQDIYMLTGHGKLIKKLTHSWGIDVSPSFSPDGKQMAFVSRRSGTPQIHILDLESEKVRRLTYAGRYNTSPSWSPDGTRIAYVAMKKGEGINIHVIGVDGSGDMQLTRHAGDNEEPSWSSDGSLIAFTSNREGTSKIYVMTAYGTDQRRLVSMAGEQFNPKWSPKTVNF